MSVGRGPRVIGRVRAARAGLLCGFAALTAIFAADSLQDAVANGDTRTISFHHLHTKENLTVTYKVNGRYDDAALQKINWELRDWRRDEATNMDPRLIDAVWEVYREVGGKEPINIISAYRAPATNAMLRRTSNGVAEASQHMHGNAMDFMIPGVSLESIRVAGLRMQRGGVGFYPTSGSPFVHMDVGSIRHWPRMTHDQLARVFPDGRTVHIPSDGKPLAGYRLALADVQRSGNRPSGPSLMAARDTGVISDDTPVPAPTGRNLLAALFGKTVREKDDAPAPAKTAARPVVLAAATPQPIPASALRLPPPRPAMPQAGPQLATASIPPLPPSRPAQARDAKPRTTTLASLSASDVISQRGYWQGLPQARSPLADLGKSKDRNDQAPTELALAYAGQAELAAPERPRPMGKALARVTTTRDATVVAKGNVLPLGNMDNPWMRAMIMAPSAGHFMSVSLLGAPDYTRLAPLMAKPAMAVMMTFSEDPHLGMRADRFGGGAVVFVATVTFVRQQSAALH